MDAISTSSVALIVVDRLRQVEADLEDAKRTMLHRLRSMALRLPAGDPDREVLEACIADLATSIRPQAPH
jgi:hypothetical protein